MSNLYFEKVNNLLEELSSKKDKMLTLLSDFTNEQLNQKYRSDKWSAAQVVYHIIKSEQLTVMAVKRSYKKINLPKISLFNRFSSKVLNLALKMPFKYKAPGIAANVPDKVDIPELLEKWAKIRTELQKLIHEFPAEKRNEVLSVHPYAGEQNLLSTLEFLLNHLNRHYNQVINIMETIKKQELNK